MTAKSSSTISSELRTKSKTTWGLHPRGEEWRWIRDEVRVDVEHVAWWDAPARPVPAVIINRPWAAAAAQGRAYKVAQHACSSHVQGQAFTSQGKSHLCMFDLDSEPPCSMHDMKPDPGSSSIAWIQPCQRVPGSDPSALMSRPGPGPLHNPQLQPQKQRRHLYISPGCSRPRVVL